MEQEERLMQLETIVNKHDERLDRHSKRLHTLEDGYMKDAVEIATMKADIEAIGAKVDTLAKGQENLGRKMTQLEGSMNGVSKWIKGLAVGIVIIFVAVCFKDVNLAKDIAKNLAVIVPSIV